MASKKRPKAPKRRARRSSGNKGGGSRGIVVFALVMAVVAFAVWHNQSPAPAPRPSAPPPATGPSAPALPAVPTKPAAAPKSAEAPKPQKPAEAVKPPKPALAQKPAEAAKPAAVSRPAAPARPSEAARTAKPLKAAAPAKPKEGKRPSGFFSFFFRPADLDSKAAPAFSRFGLTKESLVRRLSIEKESGGTAYYRTYAEYEVSRAFAWRDFVPALERALKGTPFRINSMGRRASEGFDVYTLSINRGDLNVMRLEIRSKRKVAPAPAVPPRKGPRVAIVIDDFGYSMNNVETFLNIGKPLTLAVLPHQAYSSKVANLARSRGFEVILHLPLESQRTDVGEEADTIRSGMSEDEIGATLGRELADVPGAIGVNNHQGSKGTEDPELMAVIFRYLKGRGLFFLDSLTSPRSVCRDVASSAGIRYARRTKFLDNNSDPAAIEEELRRLKTAAAAGGRVIAICHDRKNTAAVLARMMPEMASEGIEFVYLSEMER